VQTIPEKNDGIQNSKWYLTLDYIERLTLPGLPWCKHLSISLTLTGFLFIFILYYQKGRNTSMKVIALNGSPRKKWNTATLLKHALDGAASKGTETELIHLYDYNYKG
jgi:NADPH-dependent FMN reductase